MRQGTQRLGRFSFCPDWCRIPSNHLAWIPQTCMCVHLKSFRVVGSSPHMLVRGADMSRLWETVGRGGVGGEGAGSVSIQTRGCHSPAVQPWASISLHQASVSRSVSWVRGIVQTKQGNVLTEKKPFWTERPRNTRKYVHSNDVLQGSPPRDLARWTDRQCGKAEPWHATEARAHGVLEPSHRECHLLAM